MRRASISTANGLVSTCMPRFELAVADQAVFGITGDEQDFEFRTVLTTSTGHLEPVHLYRKANVIGKQVDKYIRSQHVEASPAVGRFNRALPQVLQHFRDEYADRRLVVDDQHGFTLLN